MRLNLSYSRGVTHMTGGCLQERKRIRQDLKQPEMKHSKVSVLGGGKGGGGGGSEGVEGIGDMQFGKRGRVSTRVVGICDESGEPSSTPTEQHQCRDDTLPECEEPI